MVALSGAYVSRLGGTLRLQWLALLLAVAAPYFLGANWVFQTVTVESGGEVTWMVALYWLLCLITDRRPRHWICLGITLGIGLEVKYTILGLIAGIGIAVLLTPSLRSTLRTKYPWVAAVIALLIWAPNLVWQVAEGFPSLTYITNHHGSGGCPADQSRDGRVAPLARWPSVALRYGGRARSLPSTSRASASCLMGAC